MTTSYTKAAKAAVSSRTSASAKVTAANSAPFKAKPTVTHDIHDDESVSQAQAHESIFASLNLPSGKRVLVSLFSSLFIGGCTGYLGTALTMYLAVGCAVLTGSAFLTFMVAFIGYALAILATFIVTGKAQAFILSGDIDRCYQKVSDKVVNLLGFAKTKFNWSAA